MTGPDEPDFTATEKALDDRQAGRVVQTSLGPVKIRPLPTSEIFALRGAILDVAAMDEKEDAEGLATKLMTSEGGTETIKKIEKFVLAAVYEPKLFADPAEGRTVAAFPFFDQLEIFNQVIKLAGYTKEKAATIRP